MRVSKLPASARRLYVLRIEASEGMEGVTQTDENTIRFIPRLSALAATAASLLPGPLEPEDPPPSPPAPPAPQSPLDMDFDTLNLPAMQGGGMANPHLAGYWSALSEEQRGLLDQMSVEELEALMKDQADLL